MHDGSQAPRCATEIQITFPQDPDIANVGAQTAPQCPKTHRKKWGVTTPTFCGGFFGWGGAAWTPKRMMMSEPGGIVFLLAFPKEVQGRDWTPAGPGAVDLRPLFSKPWLGTVANGPGTKKYEGTPPRSVPQTQSGTFHDHLLARLPNTRLHSDSRWQPQ